LLSNLEPQPLWRYFEDLSYIPRPSKHEEKVLTYLKEFAEARNLSWKQDVAGNLVIYRPGLNGGEGADPVVIQGHVDMVCEKNSDTVHDFANDPLQLRIVEEDWLMANGTTLGSDNGIGVAAALALLDLPLETGRSLPPLEALFTVDEETGLNGAFNLDPSLLTGRTMLNLDTEEWGALYIGCAGGGNSVVSLPVSLEPLQKGLKLFKVCIQGLLGGHSGINIHENRANAVLSLAGLLDGLLDTVEGKLVSFQGGDKFNAIPREAFAWVALKEEDQTNAIDFVADFHRNFLSEYGRLEQLSKITIAPEPEPDSQMYGLKNHHQLLSLLLTLPNGPVKISHDLPDLVETSNNVASVKVAGQSEDEIVFEVTCATRSSLSHALEHVRRRILRAAKLCGAKVVQPPSYPGWQPNLQSKLLELAKKRAREVLGEEPKVLAVHAGLECGIIGEKVKGMDMISLGPTIKGAHSPDEKVQISSVQPFWSLVLDIVTNLSQ